MITQHEPGVILIKKPEEYREEEMLSTTKTFKAPTSEFSQKAYENMR